MNIPLLKTSSEVIELRNRENQFDHAKTAIDNFVLNLAYRPGTSKLLRCVKDSLTSRLRYLDSSSTEHIAIQREVSSLESLIKQMEVADCIEHADRRMKSALGDMEVVR